MGLVEKGKWASGLTALWGMMRRIADTPLIQELMASYLRGGEIRAPPTSGLKEQPGLPCPKEYLAPLPFQIAHRLYQMVDTVGQLLTWYNVRWFVSHGTLLGTVRHGGIIPHDCDVDITVSDQDVHKLREELFLQALLLNGYELSVRPGQYLYAVFPLGVATVPALYSPQMYGPKHRGFLQIYILKTVVEKIEGTQSSYECGYLTNREMHAGFRMQQGSVFPTFLMNFGAGTVRVPAEPTKYLTGMYGDDWDSTVRSVSARVNDSYFEPRPLAEAGAGMALPTGPLLLVKFPEDSTVKL